MSVKRMILVLAATVAVQANAQTGPADSRQQVETLKAEVRELREQRAIAPVYSVRDVDAVIAAVQADASSRSHVLPSSGSAGHDDKGFFIKSDDGNFTLYPEVLAQFRGVVNYREDGKHSSSSSTESGFEMRRAKIGFNGTAFSPDLSFRFLWQDTVTGGALALQYGYVQYTFAHHVAGNGDLAIRAGQFKNIVFKEEFTPDRAQLMVERSLANSLLGGAALGSETQGVDLLFIGAENPLHAELLIDDGIRSSNTDFRDNQPVTTVVNGVSTTTNVATNFGVAGRGDNNGFWKRKDADDFTGIGGREELLGIGGGGEFSRGANNSPRTDTLRSDD